MFLLLSSLILSQNTGIPNISKDQVKEIYRGLKQNDYLKLRLQKTENTLTAAQSVISEQEKVITVAKKLTAAKDETIGNLEELRKQELEAGKQRENQLKNDLKILQGDLSIQRIEAKEKQRKRFWQGVKIGGVSVAVIGVAGFIILNK